MKEIAMRNFLSAVIAAFIAPITTAAEAFELGDRLSVALPEDRLLPDGSPLSFAGEEWPNRERHLALRAASRALASEAAYQAWAAIERAEFFGRFGLEFARQDMAYLCWEDNLWIEEISVHQPMAALRAVEVIASSLLSHEDEQALEAEAIDWEDDDGVFQLSQRVALNKRWESLYHREAVGIDRRKAKQQQGDKVRSRAFRAARKAKNDLLA